MCLNFAEALAKLGRDAGFQIANEVRPDASYVLNSLLLEESRTSCDIKATNMIVRATMPGFVGMDSAFPPGGVVETSKFSAESENFADEIYMPEETLRQLQYMLSQMGNGAGSIDFVVREALNFLNKVVIQPHRDLAEWLRGQTLAYGQIDWTFNGKRLLIDYGDPQEREQVWRWDI